jgi:hypothetical protein
MPGVPVDRAEETPRPYIRVSPPVAECGPVRRRAHRLLFAGLILVAGILVPLLTTSAGARREAPLAAVSQSYDDVAGDSSGAPDIIGATISDDSNGTLQFTISYLHLPCIVQTNALQIGIDSDRNASAGYQPGGLEYVILVSGDHSSSLEKWNGSGFDQVSPSTVTASCGSGMRSPSTVRTLASTL